MARIAHERSRARRIRSLLVRDLATLRDTLERVPSRYPRLPSAAALVAALSALSFAVGYLVGSLVYTDALWITFR